MTDCTKTFREYNSTRTAISRDYLELLQNKPELVSEYCDLHFLLNKAVSNDKIKLVKWIAEKGVAPIDFIDWHKVKSVEMAEILHEYRTEKKILKMARAVLVCPVDVVVFLHKKGHKTSVSALIRASDSLVRYKNYQLSLEKLQYFQKKYRKAITYGLLSRLEPRDDNEEYIRTHDLMECAKNNTVRKFSFIKGNLRHLNLTFLKLYDQMDDLTTHFQRPINERDLIDFYRDLIYERRIDIVEYLSSTAISLEYCEATYRDQMYWILHGVPGRLRGDELLRLIKLFKGTLGEYCQNVNTSSLKLHKLTTETALEKMRILTENGVHVKIDLYLDRVESGVLMIQLLNRKEYESEHRDLWSLYMQRYGLIAVRYIQHFIGWKDMTREDIPNLRFYPSSSPPLTPLLEFFNMAVIFFDNKNPYIYNSIRWFYYNRLRAYLLTKNQNLEELDRLISECRIDSSVRNLNKKEMVLYHKQLYSILVVIAKIDQCEDLLRDFSKTLSSYILQDSQVELIKYYNQYRQYLDFCDVIFLALTKISNGAIVKAIIELRPEMKYYTAGCIRIMQSNKTKISREIRSVLESLNEVEK